jgi:cytochrome c oxidase cbb3-type subunit 4
METYSILREFADSWMLLFLFTFFMMVILWVFRPGAKADYQETSTIPFRHADKPAAATETEKEAQS